MCTHTQSHTQRKRRKKVRTKNHTEKNISAKTPKTNWRKKSIHVHRNSCGCGKKKKRRKKEWSIHVMTDKARKKKKIKSQILQHLRKCHKDGFLSLTLALLPVAPPAKHSSEDRLTEWPFPASLRRQTDWVTVSSKSQKTDWLSDRFQQVSEDRLTEWPFPASLRRQTDWVTVSSKSIRIGTGQSGCRQYLTKSLKLVTHVYIMAKTADTNWCTSKTHSLTPAALCNYN